MSQEIAPQTAATPRRGKGLLGIGILLIIIVSVIGYFLYQTISPGKAALVIESNPVGLVYINGEQRGKTPFEIELSEEEVTIKLVPEGTSVPLSPYETKVKLTSGIKTIVRRNFGESEEAESGQIISFEKKSVNETSIAIVSIPDGVEVFVDGEKKGVSPLKLPTSPGRHTIKLSAASYEETSFEVQAVSGYTLTAIADLAYKNVQDFEGEPAEIDEEVLADQTKAPTKIEVVDTPIGYLRVRKEASVNSDEVGRVNPGDQFEFLEYDEDKNWYKIEFEDDGDTVTGWVSGEFVNQIEEE